MPQKPNFESKTIRILGEKGINSKVKDSSKRDLVTRRTGDREIVVVSGGLPDNPGEMACMINSWTAAPGNEVDRYNLLPMQPRFQINITLIKLVSKSI